MNLKLYVTPADFQIITRLADEANAEDDALGCQRGSIFDLDRRPAARRYRDHMRSRHGCAVGLVYDVIVVDPGQPAASAERHESAHHRSVQMTGRELGAAIAKAIERGRFYVPEGWDVQVDCGPEVRLVSRERGLATSWVGVDALVGIEVEGTPMSGQRAWFIGRERVYEGNEAFVFLVKQLVIAVGMAVRQMIKLVGERQHIGPRAVVVLEPWSDDDAQIGAGP